jgi:hypothetical protein
MPKMTIYFSTEEYDHVKKQPEGYVRGLVSADYDPALTTSTGAERVAYTSTSTPIIRTPKQAVEAVQESTRTPVDSQMKCKKCGSQLPYFGAKSCKMCKAKQ